MTKLLIDDSDRLKEIHDKICKILTESNITVYNGIGILETIKQEIFLENEE